MSVEENNEGEEKVTIVENNSKIKDFQINIDASRLKEILHKTVGEVSWRCHGSNDPQFICDSDSTQFFLGLNE